MTVWLLVERGELAGATLGVYSSEAKAEDARAAVIERVHWTHEEDYGVVAVTVDDPPEVP